MREGNVQRKKSKRPSAGDDGLKDQEDVQGVGI